MVRPRVRRCECSIVRSRAPSHCRTFGCTLARFAPSHHRTGARVSLSVLIAGGGTGGHLYPGIAVAREVMRRVPDATVVFVGTSSGIESRVVPRERFALETIRSAGLKGKSLTSLLRGVSLLPMSAVDAWRVLSRCRPHSVIGGGGSSSGPVGLRP